MIKAPLKWLWHRPWVWRHVASRTLPRGVAVLTYHRIVPEPPFDGLGTDRFAAQMRWLSRYCRPISAAELRHEAGGPRGAKPPVLVTFDDGYRDFHDVARPILKREGIPALMFLPTALIGDAGMLWTDEVTWLVVNATCGALSLPALGLIDASLADPPARLRVARRIKSEIKQRPDHERRELIEQLARACAPRGPRPGRQMMTWDEVRVCRDVARFGGHSHTHPILSHLDDRQLRDEIGRCRESLESELGERTEFFAYPNGRSADFDQRSRRALSQAGFTTAFTTETGWCRGDDWLAVPRLPTQAANLADFVWILSHLPRAG